MFTASFAYYASSLQIEVFHYFAGSDACSSINRSKKSKDRRASQRNSRETENIERNSGDYESSRGYTTSEDGSLKLERRKRVSRTRKHLIDACISIQRYIN